MDTPTICRMVVYRDPEGHESPAVVTASYVELEHARARGIDARMLRDLSSPLNVHLVVFSARTVHESGTFHVYNVAPIDPDKGGAGWRWPVTTQHVHTQAPPIDESVVSELVDRRLAMIAAAGTLARARSST